MTPIAPHINAFLQQRLPIERRASEHTCESYAYAFKLLFEYASARVRVDVSGGVETIEIGRFENRATKCRGRLAAAVRRAQISI